MCGNRHTPVFPRPLNANGVAPIPARCRRGGAAGTAGKVKRSGAHAGPRQGQVLPARRFRRNECRRGSSHVRGRALKWRSQRACLTPTSCLRPGAAGAVADIRCGTAVLYLSCIADGPEWPQPSLRSSSKDATAPRCAMHPPTTSDDRDDIPRAAPVEPVSPAGSSSQPSARPCRFPRRAVRPVPKSLTSRFHQAPVGFAGLAPGAIGDRAAGLIRIEFRLRPPQPKSDGEHMNRQVRITLPPSSAR